MKNYIWRIMIMAAAAIFAFVSCEKGPDTEDGENNGNGGGNTDTEYTFPTFAEVEIKAGESYTFSVECPSAFTVTLPNVQNFYIEDKDGLVTASANFDAGSHNIKIFARDNAANYDSDTETTLSMRVGSETREVRKLVVKKLARNFALMLAPFDNEETGDWLSDLEQFTKADPSQPLAFVFNYSHLQYECVIHIDCDFEWGFKNAPAWIEEMSLIDKFQGNDNTRRLTIDPEKLDLNGMTGQITFTAAVDASTVSDVETFTLSVPASNNICYAFFGNGYETSMLFNSAGEYFNSGSSSYQDNVSGSIFGTEKAKIVVAGLAADGETLEVAPAYAHVTYGDWDASMPLQSRSFVFDMDANTGYNRSAIVLAFADGNTPSNLLNADKSGINDAYAGNVVASVVQNGDRGRSDGQLLNIAECQIYGQVEMNEAIALENGLKFDKLTQDDSVAAAIAKTLGVEIETWRMTYKTQTVRTDVGPFPLGMFGSFYLTGYDSADINLATSEEIHQAVGITSPLSIEIGQNGESTPVSNYIDIKASGTQILECVVIAYEYVGNDSEGTPMNGKPLVAFHVVYNPNANF